MVLLKAHNRRFTGRPIPFRSRSTGDTRLVWLQDPNRFLQMKEPAYRVFAMMAGGAELQKIAEECRKRYGLPEREAIRFVEEVTAKVASLMPLNRSRNGPGISRKDLPAPPSRGVLKKIRLGNRSVTFRFGDALLEQYIFSQFRHLEVPPGEDPGVADLEIYGHRAFHYLVSNISGAFRWRKKDVHFLKGRVAMLLTDLAHGRKPGDWMGVFHASAVTYNGKAFLFPAGSGRGKSTLAALLAASGCGLLSDDFTPVEKGSSLVYPFPGAIGLKQGSLPVLKQYYPSLGREEGCVNPHPYPVTYITASGQEMISGRGFEARALVFVHYEQGRSCVLKKVRNREMLSGLLGESWLEGSPEAAEQFMDWFFRVPCYRLHYGHSMKAVESLLTLMSDES